MKTKSWKLIFKTIAMSMLVIMLFGSVAFATTGGSVMNLDEMKEKAKNFLNQPTTKIKIADAVSSFVPIGRILVQVGTIVLLIVGLVMGVKYMLSGANEKAQLKQKLIYYVISIVIVYGLAGIVGIVISLFNWIMA